MIISTGGIFAPSISVILPKCSISGNCFFVTAMQAGSISEAHIGLIPTIVAAKGKPPIPSNKLPSVILLIFSLILILTFSFASVILDLHKYLFCSLRGALFFTLLRCPQHHIRTPGSTVLFPMQDNRDIRHDTRCSVQALMPSLSSRNAHIYTRFFPLFLCISTTCLARR